MHRLPIEAGRQQAVRGDATPGECIIPGRGSHLVDVLLGEALLHGGAVLAV